MSDKPKYDKTKAWVEVLQRKPGLALPTKIHELNTKDYLWCAKIPLAELNTPGDVLGLLSEPAITRPFAPGDVLNVAFPVDGDVHVSTYLLVHDDADAELLAEFLWTDGTRTARPEQTPYGKLIACKIRLSSRWSRLPN